MGATDRAATQAKTAGSANTANLRITSKDDIEDEADAIQAVKKCTLAIYSRPRHIDILIGITVTASAQIHHGIVGDYDGGNGLKWRTLRKNFAGFDINRP